MIKLIRDGLLAQLNTLKGAWQPLAKVYDYMTLDIQWYPCAMIHFDNVQGEYGDSNHNKRIYNFVIYVMQEIKNVDRNTATDSVENIIDKITNLIDSSDELDGLVNNIQATGGDISEYNNGSDGRYIWGVITINLEQFYQIH